MWKNSLCSSLPWQFFIKTYSKMLRSTMSIQQPAFYLLLFHRLFFTVLVKKHYPDISFILTLSSTLPSAQKAVMKAVEILLKNINQMKPRMLTLFVLISFENNQLLPCASKYSHAQLLKSTLHFDDPLKHQRGG